MPSVPGFVGPWNLLSSLNGDAEETINWMFERTAPGTSNYRQQHIPTPGLRIFITTGNADVSCEFQQDGRAWFIAGTSFYELFTNGSSTLYGNVTRDDNPPTIHSNGTAGHQLFIVSGGLGYIFDTNANTLVQISDPGFPANALMGEFMDGYFIVLVANSRAFQISALEDGLTWDALDIGERSEGSDDVRGMVRNHRELWFLGSKTGEVWYDNGDPDFPFAPIQGVFIEQGTVNGFTMQRVRMENTDTICWIGENSDGHGVVYVASGYTPNRVSFNAIENYLQIYGFDGVRCWVYQQNGHVFYVIILPDADKSPVYDTSVDSWHMRARWDSTHCVWIPYVAQCHMFAFGKHLVGGRFTGTVYDMRLDVFDEEIVNP